MKEQPSGAIFSEDKKHRYALWRIWDDSKPLVMCIGLNPSRADSGKDDPTISIITRMLTKLDYGGFYMLNLYTYITPDPKELSEDKTSGAMWADLISEYSRKVSRVIFAWGNFSGISMRTEWVEANYQGYCFGKNKNGSPFHPLAMMYNGKQGNPLLSKFH